MSAHSGDEVDVPALSVSPAVGPSPAVVLMPEGGSAAATVMRPEAVDWSVADCKSKFVDCFDVCRFNAVF